MPPPNVAQVLTRDVAEGPQGGHRQEEDGVDAGTEYDSSDGCVTGRDIVDPAKFQDGLGTLIDGVAQCLNSSAWSRRKPVDQ